VFIIIARLLKEIDRNVQFRYVHRTRSKKVNDQLGGGYVNIVTWDVINDDDARILLISDQVHVLSSYVIIYEIL